MNIVVVLNLRLIRVTVDKTNVGYAKSKDELLKESDLTAWYTSMGKQKPQLEKVSFYI